MSITGAIVLFAVIWFMVFFIALQIPAQSQGEAGAIVPGTPASAPAKVNLRRRARITTIVTIVLWAAIFAIIVSGVITVRDLDFFHRMTPLPAGGTNG